METQPISVLLVDDQAFVGMALGRLLATEGDIALHCCHAPLEAIAEANRIGPSLILQDLQMPDIDGLTLVRMLRENAATATTPIVVLSGDDDEATRARAIAAGADGYLVKLPAKAALVTSIREHAARAAQATQEHAAADVAGRESGEAVLDPSVLEAMKVSPDADLPEFALELIDRFSDEAELRVKMLQAAAEQGDAPTLKASAHSLKGSAFVIGAVRLGAMCGRIESHLERHPDGSGTLALVAALPEELVHVRRAFADFRQGTQ